MRHKDFVLWFRTIVKTMDISCKEEPQYPTRKVPLIYLAFWPMLSIWLSGLGPSLEQHSASPIQLPESSAMTDWLGVSFLQNKSDLFPSAMHCLQNPPPKKKKTLEPGSEHQTQRSSVHPPCPSEAIPLYHSQLTSVHYWALTNHVLIYYFPIFIY